MNFDIINKSFIGILVGLALCGPAAAAPAGQQEAQTAIQRVAHNGHQTLATGDSLKVSVRGEPGSQASFSVLGHLSDWPMKEYAPGYYQGELPIGRGLEIRDGVLVVTMSHENGRSVAQSDTGVNISAETGLTLPDETVVEPSFPDPGEVVAEARPRLQFTLAKSFRPDSVRLSLDGIDVSREVLVLGQQIVWEPKRDLTVGAHLISVKAETDSGESLRDNWTFRIHPLAYGLDTQDTWVSVTEVRADQKTILVAGESRPFSVVTVEARPVARKLDGLAVLRLPARSEQTLTDAQGRFTVKFAPDSSLSLDDQVLVITPQDPLGRDGKPLEIDLND